LYKLHRLIVYEGRLTSQSR